MFGYKTAVHFMFSVGTDARFQGSTEEQNSSLLPAMDGTFNFTSEFPVSLTIFSMDYFKKITVWRGLYPPPPPPNFVVSSSLTIKFGILIIIEFDKFSPK